MQRRTRSALRLSPFNLDQLEARAMLAVTMLSGEAATPVHERAAGEAAELNRAEIDAFMGESEGDWSFKFLVGSERTDDEMYSFRVDPDPDGEGVAVEGYDDDETYAAELDWSDDYLGDGWGLDAEERAELETQPVVSAEATAGEGSGMAAAVAAAHEGEAAPRAIIADWLEAEEDEAEGDDDAVAGTVEVSIRGGFVSAE